MSDDRRNAIEEDEQLDGFEEDIEVPDQNKLESVATYAKRMVELNNEIVRIEEQLKLKKADLEAITDRDLPLAMTEAGMTDFGLTGGARIEIAQMLEASVPSGKNVKDEEQRARLLALRSRWFTWLKANGHDSIIKHAVEVSFPKGKEKDAAFLAKSIEGMFDYDVKVSNDQSVHNATLLSFIRGQLAKGTEFPEDLEVRVGQRAKIIQPKADKF